MDSEADPDYVEKKLKEIQDKIANISDDEAQQAPNANPFEVNNAKKAKKKVTKEKIPVQEPESKGNARNTNQNINM